MNKFDSEDKKNGFEDINDIIKKIEQYSNNQIEENLASIHTRVEELSKYNRIKEDSEDSRKNRLYYPIKAIKQLHTEVVDEYTKYYPLNELGQKATVMGKLYVANEKLMELEKGNDSDE